MTANHVQKKNATNFLSSTRHAVATIIKPDMNLMYYIKNDLMYYIKNDLFTDSVNMNITYL